MELYKHGPRNVRVTVFRHHFTFERGKVNKLCQCIILFILTQCCEATEFRVWVPIECRWTTRWLNHSAGGNCAENVASAAGGADEPLCLRPLLLNKRDSNDIFSGIQKAKCGIWMPHKHTVSFIGLETSFWICHWSMPMQNNSRRHNAYTKLQLYSKFIQLQHSEIFLQIFYSYYFHSVISFHEIFHYAKGFLDTNWK
jgi:hypothetical protein